MQKNNKSNPAIQVLLFDLGGVLVQFDGITPLVKLSGNRLSREEARRFWLSSPSVRSFESGNCTPDKFGLGVVKELGLELDPDSFLKEFITWDRGPMEGALSLLDSLRPHFLLACLSNNNELHWQRLRDEMGLAGKFHQCYLSHEMGLLKPDREVFNHVIQDLAVHPDRILFLDDNPECIDTARAAGMTAHQACGVSGVHEVLTSLALLPGASQSE